MKRRESPRPLCVEALERRLNMAAYTVNTLADDTASDAVLSLREATLLVNNLGNANAALGRLLTAGETAQINTSSGLDNIYFSPSLNNSRILLSDSRLSLTRSVNIQGPGADKLVISGGDVGTQHFFIDGRTNGSINVVIAGLTLSSGNANGIGGTVTPGGVNTALHGGSIFIDSATVVIADSNFTANQATLGGAIHNSGGITTVRNSTFYNNIAVGAGISTVGGSFTLQQSTVSGNQSQQYAGGIYLGSGNLIVQQSTIVSNTINVSATALAGGIYANSGTISLSNTVVAGNSSLGDNSVRDLGGIDPTGNNNFIGNTNPAYNGGFSDGVNGNIVRSATTASLVGPIQKLGPIPTHFPVANSLLLDAGSNSNAPFSSDQWGRPRVVDGPDGNTTATVDIGASEGTYLRGPIVVDHAVDEDDGFYSTGNLSLREAVRVANEDPAEDTISFAAGVTTISLTIDTITITDAALTTITSNGVVVERRSDASNFGIFGIGNDASAVLQGLTIRNGNSDRDGGGIYNLGTLTVVNSTLTGNSASFDGGGIFNNGTLTVTNSTFSGNTADFGGGIENFGTLRVTNSTFTGNSATSSGGGISTTPSPTLRNTIVAGNFLGTPDVANDIGGIINGITSYNNLIGDAGSAGGLTHGNNGNIVGVAVASVLNPILTNNGGPTSTHALAANSPAINAGSNDATNSVGLTTDQRGVGFSRIVGGNVDIGAVELPAPTTFSLAPNLLNPSSNQQLTITVNLTGSPLPTGSVMLHVDGVPGTAISLVSGQVQFTLNSLPVGLHTIFSRYSGDPNYVGVDSSVLNQQVFQQSDVNRSGTVEINDILAAIFVFNTNAIPIPVANLPPGPPFPDATGDGQFDINDLLRIIFDFNQTLISPEGEAATASSSSTTSPTPTVFDEVFADEYAWLWAELPTTKRHGTT